MANSTHWQTAGMRLTLEVLAEAGRPVHRQEIMAELKTRLSPSGEDVEIQSNNHEKWWSYVALRVEAGSSIRDVRWGPR